jgi:hypothetical protein
VSAAADSAVIAALKGLSSVMARWGNRWYLFGAQAVTVWGRPRMSADVDVTASVETRHEAFIDDMGKEGFELRVADWQDFMDRTRVLPFLYRAANLPVDMVLAGPGLEEDFLDRAILVEMSGVSVPVISPEDLLVTKIFAGRPKDLEDVFTVLIRRRGEVDLARVRSLLGMLEEALSRRDLVSEFERAVTQSQLG